MAGAFPRCQWVRGGVNPGQAANNNSCLHSRLRAILESPINLTCMCLDCERKLKHLKKTHAGPRRTFKLHTKKPEPASRSQSSDNHCITVPSVLWLIRSLLVLLFMKSMRKNSWSLVNNWSTHNLSPLWLFKYHIVYLISTWVSQGVIRYLRHNRVYFLYTRNSVEDRGQAKHMDRSAVHTQVLFPALHS